MEEESVERVFGPIYPRAFTCDGAVCGSLCCGRWHIPVDALTRKRWESLPESARDEIFGNLSETERGWGMRHGENGNCAFLDGDGLCRLQKKYGEDVLSDICYSYPRVAYRFDGFVERSLAVSCPVAARLVLLSPAPMTVGWQTLPARRAAAAIRPPMEALRWETCLPSIQLRTVAVLQNRELSLRQRFLRLGKFFAALEARCGNRPPEEETIRRCALDAEAEAPAVPRAEPLPRLRYMAALMAALYETEYPAERLEALAHRVAAIEEAAEEELNARRRDMLENLAVSEFFLRLYPFACDGGLLTNFKLFALRFRLAEFSLLLSAAAEGAAPGEETALTMLGRVMERLDHSRDADNLLRRCVAEDMRGLDAAQAISLL